MAVVDFSLQSLFDLVVRESIIALEIIAGILQIALCQFVPLVKLRELPPDAFVLVG